MQVVRGWGKEPLCKRYVDFLIEKEAGEVPKTMPLENAQPHPSSPLGLGQILEGGLLWWAASKRGEKLLLQEDLQDGQLIGHPKTLAVMQVSCCSFWSTSVKETPSTSPHMPQRATDKQAMVKRFVLILRYLKSQGRQEQDMSWPAAISPFRQVDPQAGGCSF